MLFIQTSERGLFETGYFATNIYNALQFILVFLTDVPKPTYKRKCQKTLYTRFIKHGQYRYMKILSFVGLSDIMAHPVPSIFAFLKAMMLELHQTIPSIL